MDTLSDEERLLMSSFRPEKRFTRTMVVTYPRPAFPVNTQSSETQTPSSLISYQFSTRRGLTEPSSESYIPFLPFPMVTYNTTRPKMPQPSRYNPGYTVSLVTSRMFSALIYSIIGTERPQQPYSPSTTLTPVLPPEAIP